MHHIASPGFSATTTSGVATPGERATDVISVTAERTACVVNGYWIGEVKERTKGKLKEGWPEFRGVPVYDARYTGTIVLCEGYRALDFDISDPRVLEEVMRLALECGIPLGETIYRGRSDGSIRAIFLFRAQRPVSSAAWPGKRRLMLTGKDNAIDILGAGQQFIGFCQHENGSYYTWPRGSPRDRAHGSLPIVTEAMIDALSSKLAEAGLLVSETGRQGVARAAGSAASNAGVAASTAPGALSTPLLRPDGEPAVKPAGMAERIAAGESVNSNFIAGVHDSSDINGVSKAIGILDAMPNDFPLGHPLRLNRDQWRDLAFSAHWVVDEVARRRGENPQSPPWTATYLADDNRMKAAFETFSASYTEDPDPANKILSASDLWEKTRNPHSITAGKLVYLARERIANFDLLFGMN